MRIEFSALGAKNLRKFRRYPNLLRRIGIGLDRLSEDAHLGKPLEGQFLGEWSYRVGDYRIIYEIHQQLQIILIVRIEHRKQSYRIR